MGRTTGSLTAALARDVPLYIRSRAEKYIRSGRAAVIEWADARIVFQVQGSDVYLVYNHSWAGSSATAAARGDWQLQAKLTYLFQR